MVNIFNEPAAEVFAKLNTEEHVNSIKNNCRGGKRPGAGRKKGSRDVATVDQRASLAALARAHTPLAIKTLVRICREAESEAAAVSAATALLDRAYGKPAQSMEFRGDPDVPVGLAERVRRAGERARLYEESRRKSETRKTPRSQETALTHGDDL